MKTLNTLIFSIFLLLNSWPASSQTLEPIQSTIEHNNGTRACLEVNLDPEPKTLKKAWTKYLRKEYHVKLKGKGLFGNKYPLYSHEVRISEISSKQMDFYTNIIEDENGSEMKVFASYGYDIYLNQENYPAEYILFKDILVSFLKDYLPGYYQEGIKDATKKVKKLKKEISSLDKNIKKDTKKIESFAKDVDNYKISLKENSEKLVRAEAKLKGRELKLARIRTKLEAL